MTGNVNSQRVRANVQSINRRRGLWTFAKAVWQQWQQWQASFMNNLERVIRGREMCWSKLGGLELVFSGCICPHLSSWYAKGRQIEKRGNPAIESTLLVAYLYLVWPIGLTPVLPVFLERNILNQCRTPNIHKDPSDPQLDQSPSGEDCAACCSLWTAHRHPHSCTLLTSEAYMEKTCDVAGMAILAKKICGKSA